VTITIEWDNPEKTVILWHSTEVFSMEEFWEAQDQIFVLASAVNRLYPVDVIIWSESPATFPKGLLTNMRSTNTRIGRHASKASESIVVIVVNNRMGQTISNLIQQLFGAKRWRTAANVPEARQLIQAYRSTATVAPANAEGDA
jgi:hypothetical protein